MFSQSGFASPVIPRQVTSSVKLSRPAKGEQEVWFHGGYSWLGGIRTAWVPVPPLAPRLSAVSA